MPGYFIFFPKEMSIRLSEYGKICLYFEQECVYSAIMFDQRVNEWFKELTSSLDPKSKDA